MTVENVAEMIAVNNEGSSDPGCSEESLLGNNERMLWRWSLGYNEGSSDGRYEEWSSISNDERNSEMIAGGNNEGWLDGRFEEWLLSNYECMSSTQSIGYNEGCPNGCLEKWSLRNNYIMTQRWSQVTMIMDHLMDAPKNDDCLGMMKECGDDWTCS